MARRAMAGLAAACILLAGCGGGGGDDAERAGSDDSTSTEAPDDTAPDASDAAAGDTTTMGGETPTGAVEGWTVLVYSIADTDLEPFLLQDVGEMGDVGSGENLDIVALVDRATDYSSDPVLGLEDWQGGKLLHVQQGSADELADLGDVDTGDPALLADFIAAGIAQFPAEHYALIISDHGASWPGVGGDESSGHNTLDMAELEAGIGEGLAAAGVAAFDLLGFDACLMATYEVAASLAPYADRLLASQELEPGHGWDYRVLQMLEDDPATDVDTLGAALVDGFAAQAEAEGTESGITLGLIDLTQMPAVEAAVSELAVALAGRADALGPVIGRTRSSTLSFGRNPDPANDTHMADLGILVSEIGVQALDVSDQADAVVRALNDAVLYSANGAAMRGATGLSIYFPPEAQWFAGEYTEIPATADWSAFLSAYYAGGAAIPVEEQPQFVTDAAEVFFDQDGLNVSGTFDIAAQGNLTTAAIDYGIVEDDGSITFIGTEPATVLDDGSGTVFGIYDLTALTISDGVDTAYAYLDLSLDEEAGLITIDVPLAYYPPGESELYEDVLLSLVFDSDVNLLSETYYAYDDELGTYGELTADPEGIIVPTVLSYGADGTSEWVPTSDVGLYADLPSLSYDVEPLESGTPLYVELSVTDFGGNSDYVFAYADVP